MKHYKIQYPDESGNCVEEILSEQEILDTYWEYWYKQMIKVSKAVGKPSDTDWINPENCIKDWITIHWAWEVGDED